MQLTEAELLEATQSVAVNKFDLRLLLNMAGAWLQEDETLSDAEWHACNALRNRLVQEFYNAD